MLGAAGEGRFMVRAGNRYPAGVGQGDDEGPDVVLFGLSAAGREAGEMLAQMTAALPHAGIIVLTAPGDEERGEAALAAGAAAHLREADLNPVLLQNALRHAARLGRMAHELRMFRRAVEQSPDTIIVTDIDGNIVYVNPRFTELTGYTAEEVLGQNPRILKTGYTSQEEYRRLWQTITSGQVWRGIFLNRKKNGDLYWESAAIGPVTDDAGRIVNFVGVKEDITAARQMAQRLEESEQRYRELFDGVPTGLYRSAPDGRIIDANLALVQLLGYPDREALLAVNAADLYMDPADRRRLLEAVARDGAAAADLQLRRFDGAPIWVADHMRAVRGPDGSIDHYQGALGDLTQRKQTEQALERLNRAYLVLSRCNHALVHATDEAALLREVCHVLVEIGGFRLAWIGFAGDPTARRIHVVAAAGHDEGFLQRHPLTLRGRPATLPPTARAIRTGQTVVVRHVDDDPALKPLRAEMLARGYLSVAALPLRENGGAFGSLVVYAGEGDAFGEREISLLEELTTDLTFGIQAIHTRARREQAEQALRESELRFRTLVSSMDDIIFTLDSAERHTGVFGHWVERAGLTPETFLGRTAREILGEEAARVHEENNARALAGESTVYEWSTGSGEDRTYYQTSLSPMRDEDGTVRGLVGVGRDITGIKRMEAEEREQRRFAQALASAAAMLNASLNLAEVLDPLLELLGQIVSYDAASIMLVEDGTARAMRAHGQLDDDMRDWLLSQSYDTHSHVRLSQILRDGEPLIIPDIREELKGQDNVPAQAYDLPAYLGVPIMLHGHAIGFINLYRAEPGSFASPGTAQPIGIINLYRAEPGSFTPTDAARTLAFAYQVASAIWNARLYHELEAYSGFLEQAVEQRTAELRAVKERVEAILKHSPDAILLLDADGHIQVANPAIETLTGCRVEEALGRSLPDLCHPTPPALLHEALGQVIAGDGPHRLEIQTRCSRGDLLDVDLAMSPLLDEGRLTGVVCTLRDVSRLKEVERMKDAFVSNVSHELRTPITGLKLNYRLLGIDPQNSAVYIERLGREINRLNDLIEDLLRLSRLDQGRVALKLQSVDLAELAARHVADREPLATSQSLTLTFEAGADVPPVQADRGLLEQVLSVLLTNAINYTPPGGCVVVRTRAREQMGQRWAGFSVLDSGPGIPPDEQPHLFERFFRGRVGRESGKPGTGLGLAIAAEIVRRHSGHIEIGPGLDGRGAGLTVWLPGTAEDGAPDAS
ncbi:MAG: hypothetical protein Kow00124_16420 [Anaerolineae bacterium]